MSSAAPSTPAPQVVFTEIPAADPARARAFYEMLLGTELVEDTTGENPVWLFPPAENGGPAGHLYPGKPALDGNGMTAHFAVGDDLTSAMERVKRGGGEVLSDIIEIYAGTFFYAKDSEGNSLGLFKYKS